jgi:hypothetical protein
MREALKKKVCETNQKRRGRNHDRLCGSPWRR